MNQEDYNLLKQICSSFPWSNKTCHFYWLLVGGALRFFDSEWVALRSCNQPPAFMPFQILNATLPLFLASMEKVKQLVLFMSTGIPITNKADRIINTKALKNMH